MYPSKSHVTFISNSAVEWVHDPLRAGPNRIEAPWDEIIFDLEGIVATFEPDGYAREPSGGAYLHRGAEDLREVYVHMFANGRGISLEHCTLTEDGVRCAIE